MKSQYLTEILLEKFLLETFPNKTYTKNKKAFKQYSFRPDFVFHDLKLVIEFDGYHHFTNDVKVFKDLKQDSILKALDYTVIRIPYFIQLNSEEIIKFIFDISKPKFNLYPHGFIDPKCGLPGTFSRKGLEKFIDYINKLPFKIKYEIFDSLYHKWEHGSLLIETFPFINNYSDLLLRYPKLQEEYDHLKSIGWWN